jgi:hypothetical protein
MRIFPKTVAAMLAVSLASVLFYSQAGARPIVGSIDFGGVVTYDTTSLATAARVNIWNSSFVLQDSGDFSSISPGTHSTMAAPWIFNPSTNTPGLWSVGGFTFNLSSATITTQTANFLNISGVGTITSTTQGLDPTPGVWTFNSTNSNGSNSSTFGFQATTDPVPEPSTVAFLALSGFGLIASRYFRNLPRIKMPKLPKIFAVRCGPL